MKFSAPKIKAPSYRPAKPMKVHPAAMQTRVRLPDTGSIGTDPSPIVPNTGKI